VTGLEGGSPVIETPLSWGLPPLFGVPGGGVVKAGSVTDSKLTEHVASGGFMRVGVVGGGDDGFTRRAEVDIEHFAATRSAAYALAEQTRGILLSKRTIGGVVIDRLVTVSEPKRVPWDNSNIRRFLATYRISTRR